MKELEVTYRREVTFSKRIKVSDKLAKRLLKLDGESDLLQRAGSWGGRDEDKEKVSKDVYKEDDVSTDDFTMLAEDLTDIHDVYDMMNEISDINISKAKKR
jgi:hypothetical protein